MNGRGIFTWEAGKIRRLLEGLYWKQGLSQYLVAARLGVSQQWVSKKMR